MCQVCLAGDLKKAVTRLNFSELLLCMTKGYQRGKTMDSRGTIVDKDTM